MDAAYHRKKAEDWIENAEVVNGMKATALCLKFAEVHAILATDDPVTLDVYNPTI